MPEALYWHNTNMASFGSGSINESSVYLRCGMLLASQRIFHSYILPRELLATPLDLCLLNVFFVLQDDGL